MGYGYEMLNLCHVVFVLFITQLTLFVCVWWWSCNSLHGSRCWCKWAWGCLETKWGVTMGILLVFFLEDLWTILYWLYKYFIVVILERHSFI